MKHKLSDLDMASVSVIGLNLISFLGVGILMNVSYTPNALLELVMTLLGLYAVFGSVGAAFVGVASNIISLLHKRKEQRKITVNFVFFALYFIMVPIWWEIFWIAALSV